MNRDELILIGVNAEREAEGLPPLAADHPWTGHHSMVRATLAALEAAGVEIAPKKPTSTMIRDGVSHRLSTKISGENTWPEDTAALYTTMLAANPYRSAP